MLISNALEVSISMEKKKENCVLNDRNIFLKIKWS